LWMSLFPCSLRKKYFIVTLCSIRSTQIFISYLNGYVKCKPRKVLSARLYVHIFSLNTYYWFGNWVNFENAIWLLIIFGLEKDTQAVRYFSLPSKSTREGISHNAMNWEEPIYNELNEENSIEWQ
jgi:hypothetical protein